MSFRWWAIGILLAWLTLVAETASGGVVIYDEIASGDISGTPVLGILDVGTNSVSGSLTGGDGAEDNFRVTLPFGLEITEVTITTTNGNATGDFLAAIVDGTSPDAGLWSIVKAFPSGVTPLTSDAVATLPPYSTPGDYRFDHYVYCDSPSYVCDYSDNYSIAITVGAIAIPEPSAALCCSLTLAMVAGRAWLRRNWRARG